MMLTPSVLFDVSCCIETDLTPFLGWRLRLFGIDVTCCECSGSNESKKHDQIIPIAIR